MTARRRHALALVAVLCTVVVVGGIAAAAVKGGIVPWWVVYPSVIAIPVGLVAGLKAGESL